MLLIEKKLNAVLVFHIFIVFAIHVSKGKDYCKFSMSIMYVNS